MIRQKSAGRPSRIFNAVSGKICRKDVRQFLSEQFLKQAAGIALQFRGSAGDYPLPKYEETLPPERRGHPATIILNPKRTFHSTF